MSVDLVDLVSQFRMTVYKHFPYLSPYIYSLTPVERPGLGTMAVDKYGRMYYDPAWCETLTLEQGGYVVVHEGWHLILRHCHRAKAIIGDNPSPQELRNLNIAMDICVWEMMEAIAGDAPEGGVTLPKAKEKWPKIKRNMTVEELYSIINEPPPKGPTGGQPDTKEDDKGGQGEEESTPQADGNEDQRSEDGESSDEPGDSDKGDSNGGDSKQPGDESTPEKDGQGTGSPQGNGAGQSDDQAKDDGFDLIGGGSAADGIDREYEEEYDPSWDAYREDRMLESIENKIKELEKDEEWVNSRGTIPGSLTSLIKRKLHPQPNPWDSLRATVSMAAKAPRGNPDYTYQRPNRRQNAVPGMPLLKGVQKYSPKAVVVVDTSGSMTPSCKVKIIQVCAQGLQAIGKFPVICGDVRVQSDSMLAGMTDQFEFPGGGGTDMRPLIDYAIKKYNPDVIILGTDGGTPWHDKAIRPQLIIALTQNSQCPEWATVVRIPNNPRKDRLDDNSY